MRKNKPLKGMTARSYGIFGDHDETYTYLETDSDVVAVVWSGLLSCGPESSKLFGGILPPDMPAIYPNHRGHGPPSECSGGVISFPGIREDIRKVSDLTKKMGFRKLLKVYNSISCPAGLADLIESAKYNDSAENKLPRQDATIFISPSDYVHDYLPRLIKAGCKTAKLIPKWLANVVYAPMRPVARNKFQQMDDGVTRIRYMNMNDPHGILLGLNSFSRMSEIYAGYGNELKGDSILVIYGDHDSIIPREDFHKFIQILERRGADVTVVPMDSGHRVTAPNGNVDSSSLDVEVDEKKVTYLNGIVSKWLDGIRILEPYGEEDLMTMTERVETYSDGSKPKFYIPDTESHFEGGGVPLYII